MAESASSQSFRLEGKNIQLFRVRMRGIYKQMVEGISAERFAEISREILSDKNSRCLLKFWQDKVLEDSLNDLDEIFTESKLDEKLRELENVIKQNQLDSNIVAWRPPGNPTEHMRSLDMHEKLKIKKEWEEFVNKKEASVNQLTAEVKAGRAEALEFEKTLNSHIDNLQKSNAIDKSILANRRAILKQLTLKE